MDRLGAASSELLLARFGVSPEAEALWRVLIAMPDATVEAIASETGLRAGEIEAAIDALLDAQLVRGGSSPSGVLAIDPALAIEAHIARAERQMAEQTAAFAALRTRIPDLVDTHSHGRSSAGEQPGFEVVVGLQDIRRQIALAADRTRADVRSLDYQLTLPQGEKFERHQLEVLDRGVRDRLIVRPEEILDPDVFARYKRFEASGHRIRTLPNIETRLLLYDRDLAVLPVDPTKLDQGAIFIRVRSVIDVLILMYDHMWSIATPIFSNAPDQEAPTGRTAQVLELLALGTKDESIARMLGVGVRTIRREIAELKTALGVHSRTEIVGAAIRKGWL